MKKRNPVSVFGNAVRGCVYAFSTQPNFLIHLLISIIVVGLGIWLKVSPEKFLILLLTIVLGLGMEMANTAFEAIVDLVTPRFHPQAKIVKDVAAGMMLLSAIGAAVLGILILLPPLIEKLFWGNL